MTSIGTCIRVQTTDVFDDVMEDVLARGVIGDEADGDRVRGAVGV